MPILIISSNPLNYETKQTFHVPVMHADYGIRVSG